MVFSILIAHYQNWNYFQQCYQSILEQSFQDFEIIIVDDCSSDDSYEHLELLSQTDKRINLFRNSENQGVGYTKSKCIEKASGDILGFLDPDDALSPMAIEKSIQQYENDQEVVGTYSQIMMCDSDLTPLTIYSRTRKVKNSNPYFFNINNEVSHFFTFKKSAYKKTHGINKNLTSAVDFDMYLKIYEKGSFQYIRTPLYLYRQHDKGVSQDKTKKTKLSKNWNKVLFDTCKRREITKIGNHTITEDSNLSNIIFESERGLFMKIKRYLRKD